MSFPTSARIYLWLMAGAAGFAVLGSLAVVMLAGDAWASQFVAQPGQAFVLAQLVALSVAAQHFPLTRGPKRKFDLSQAVHLAIILLAGMPLAVLLTGVAELIGQGSYVLRRDRVTGRPRIGINAVIFNTSQIVVVTALAGIVWDMVRAATAGTDLHPFGIDLETLLGVPAAAVTLYLGNSVAVATMVGLHGGRRPIAVWRQGLRWSAILAAGLLPLGALTAHIAAQSPLAPLAMVLPAALTYVSLKRSVEAEAAVRLRDDFLGVAAHELRTPITSLRGYAQLLVGTMEKGVALDEAKLERSLKTIDRQSAKLCGLIDQLLDLSRMQNNQLTLERHAFDLTELAREAAASLQGLTPGFALSVHAAGPVPVHADRLRLEQVLANLVTNAVRHAGNAGKGDQIVIEVLGPGQQLEEDGFVSTGVTLAVRDYGAGIAREYRERIFDRFYQIGDDGKAGGLGIGLFVTREIVGLHGGTIKVECPRSGGTRFLITLDSPEQCSMRAVTGSPAPVAQTATV